MLVDKKVAVVIEFTLVNHTNLSESSAGRLFGVQCTPSTRPISGHMGHTVLPTSGAHNLSTLHARSGGSLSSYKIDAPTSCEGDQTSLPCQIKDPNLVEVKPTPYWAPWHLLAQIHWQQSHAVRHLF